jgi:hypothetical protein
MNVAYMHLCDYAMHSQDLKTSVIGIFSRIQVADLPSLQMGGYLVFGLETEGGSMAFPDSITIRVECLDPSDNVVFALTGESGQTRIAPTSPVSIAHQIVKLPAFPLKETGVHRIRVSVMGFEDATGSVRFDVSRMVGGPAPAGE